MRRETKLMWAAVAVLLVAVGVQRTPALSVFGVRPDLVLVSLIVLSFFIPRIFSYGLLTIIAASALRFLPGIRWEIVILTLIPILAFLLRRKLVLHGVVASTILIAGGTLAFYLFTAPRFLYHNSVTLVIESLYNTIVGALVYFVFWFYYGERSL